MAAPFPSVKPTLFLTYIHLFFFLETRAAVRLGLASVSLCTDFVRWRATRRGQKLRVLVLGALHLASGPPQSLEMATPQPMALPAAGVRAIITSWAAGPSRPPPPLLRPHGVRTGAQRASAGDYLYNFDHAVIKPHAA